MTNKEKGTEQESALHVMGGVTSSHDGTKRTARRKFVKKEQPANIHHLVEKIISGSRLELAQGITLIESVRKQDQSYAQELLQKALPHTGASVRIGISGVPGAGKSTFIETFGLMLCELGYKVAVLAIDPSSTVTGGSILGDKTRMQNLANHPNAFIRPSPTSGTLGGVHRKTRETMLLCEAAGYDVILIETVGVGQSETAVRNMVDFFALLALTGAGDDLQGMKKGIMEITDLIIVHKADGENRKLAKRTVREYKQILHYLQPATPGWQSTALPVSSLQKTGHKEVWELIQAFKEKMLESNFWKTRRQEQTKSWFHDMIHDRLIESFFNEEGKKRVVSELEKSILNSDVTVTAAVEQLFAKKV
ncbi:methylmalonyl Co-A mutase-associated GTPase MeaB [Pseudogracilibacillus auburnensis]|uniref:Methylmalonyl-CoA mutase metallochaperone MeaB n=1 Tax=Pseudogracilibacillus auburnensis TaxID=1494959 RepID=A0A2V3VGM4_9BACI|nr:methylmalonyl Co-A mutase-associated GTPase MeaB [Pseudogracilibacillus auburnensis]PXW80966.1 methylmalonyl-CoA mutase metallochaperone MeaB [Pseudogracilibacillus auburnensis]